MSVISCLFLGGRMLNNVVRKLLWVLKMPKWPERVTGMLALEGTPEHILVHIGRC